MSNNIYEKYGCTAGRVFLMPESTPYQILSWFDAEHKYGLRDYIRQRKDLT